MELELLREPSRDGCTIGRLAVDGAFCCWTLEDVVRDGPKVQGQTAIPSGRYRVAITKSQRFGVMLPLVLDVPGFEGVRIHAGNTAADTDGCILVGQSRGVRSILGSRAALGDLQGRLARALASGDRVMLTVYDAKESHA